MITKTQRNAPERKSEDTAIPDVLEWISEYQFIVSLFEAVKKTTQLLKQSDHFSETATGELILTEEAKDCLKANFHEADWEYLENYLFG
ncbi:MAG: hypothetical protein N3E45_12440 [Oscillatoriaceae bacterium SKW80]|nr:hypothetical protein [Oscillatoriaceae bacterium SKYG93]MCX8121611.1 hypothetical protein [Oscillatoriaceae bacterium SKW80]MDW8453919.1 hypothetical protein [Oscillatoriaceae cyanobacterium SKYGB_i_bin93]HIK28838.1 hypothetical protein [Oscillatoriaceae cyanobacterium M7585_C2015_266]